MDLQTVSQIVDGRLSFGADPSARFSGVSIDTRTLSPGELFVALCGAQVDGHSFVQEALSRKSAGAIIQSQNENDFAETAPLVVVDNTALALRELARQYRIDTGATYVGITGSTGKTTVKEMVAYLLKRAKKSIYASQGNLNNLFGLPISIMRMDQSVEFGVFELGVSTPGEMRQLAPILQPTVGVITNISATHLEFLHTIEGVRQEKVELLAHLSGAGVAVIEAEDSNLVSLAKKSAGSVITFSANPNSDADLKPNSVSLNSQTGCSEFSIDTIDVSLKLFGEHQMVNALCALAVCRALEVEIKPQWLSEFEFASSLWRGEIETIGGLTLILDCYNANPASMKSGLGTFFAFSPKDSAARKIAALGDMLELGTVAEKEHRDIGELLAVKMNESTDVQKLDMLVTVGESAKFIADSLKKALSDESSLKIFSVETSAEAGALLAGYAKPGDAIYFKASRGIKLEDAVTQLKGGAFSRN